MLFTLFKKRIKNNKTDNIMITQNTYKKRFCFLCLNPLFFEDYVQTNISLEEFLLHTNVECKEHLVKIIFTHFKELELVKLWEAEQVELACCHCQKFVRDIMECKITFDLLEWADDERLKKLKSLDMICTEDILELNRLKEEDE